MEIKFLLSPNITEIILNRKSHRLAGLPASNGYQPNI